MWLPSMMCCLEERAVHRPWHKSTMHVQCALVRWCVPCELPCWGLGWNAGYIPTAPASLLLLSLPHCCCSCSCLTAAAAVTGWWQWIAAH